MSNNDKKHFNQIIWMLVSPPYFFLAINYLKSKSDPSSLDDFYGVLRFENYCHLGPIPFWIFPVLYGVLYYFRHNENIDLVSKILVSGSASVSLFDPITPSFTIPLFVFFALFTGVLVFFLYWEIPIGKDPNKGGFALTLDKKGKEKISEKSLHDNLQVIGGTGTGKTHYVIKPFIQQTIGQGLGCFILDVKSNVFRDIAFYAVQAKGRTIKHFNLSEIKCSHTYNPLFGDNADAIANRVFNALYFDKTGMEPFYVELANAFLHNLVALLKKDIKTLTFQDLLTATQEVDTFRTISHFCAKYQDSAYARYFRDQWLGKAPKERRTELSGLINKLQRFCNNEWAHLLNVRDPDIRMKKAMENGEIILFSPDSARYPEDAKPLSILAMMDMAEQLADRYKDIPEKPFRVFLDEFYNLAYPKFIDFINKCREAKVNLIFAHQSNGDLFGVSKEFLEQVMNTATNKIVLRVNDPDTAESFARQFGTEQDQNYRVESYGAQGNLAGYSSPKVEKFRFHPNQIKELRIGEAIVKQVEDGRVQIRKIQLKPAEGAPRNFYPMNALEYKPSREPVNESSLLQVVPAIQVSPEKQPKNVSDKMGDDDAA